MFSIHYKRKVRTKITLKSGRNPLLQLYKGDLLKLGIICDFIFHHGLNLNDERINRGHNKEKL